MLSAFKKKIVPYVAFREQLLKDFAFRVVTVSKDVLALPFSDGLKQKKIN